jgi:selenium metabolism protein YedF
MTSELDCRGLACPAPVLQTKGLLEKDQPEAVTVMVDNEAARQNVTRFLQSQGFSVSSIEEGRDFRVVGRRQEGRTLEPAVCAVPEPARKKIMVMVGTDRLGHGDDELGSKLMASFMGTLKEMGGELWRLVLVNNGVKLTVSESPVLTALKALEASGVSLLVCGTCLNHFNLLDKKQVGETTNMLDIVTSMQVADSVINI